MFVGQWEIYYIALGSVVVAATTIVAARSPRRTRIWYICLLFGLAVATAGAFGIEELRYEGICHSLGLVSGRGCQSYHIEESLEFLGIWPTLLAVLGQFSDVTPRRLRRRFRLIVYLMPAIAFVLLLLSTSNILRHLPRTLSTHLIQFEYQFLAQPISVEFESDVRLLAFRTDQEADTFTLWLYASTSSWNAYSGLGYSVHLVDPVTGESVAGKDEFASRKNQWQPARDLWLYKEQITVHVPAQSPAMHALRIVLSAWREEDGTFVPQRILSTDHQLLRETQVVLGQLVLPAE